MTEGAAKLRYVPIQQLTREQSELALSSDPGGAARALWSIALYDPDDDYAEAVCLKYLASDHEALQKAAIGALGDMAWFIRRNVSTRADNALHIFLVSQPQHSEEIAFTLGLLEQARARVLAEQNGSAK